MRIFSKRSLEGYVLIDNRDSPGIPFEQSLRAGLPTMPVPAGRRFEGKTRTCSHCQQVSILNPLRVRPRGHCPKCDRHLCDRCALIYSLTLECVPFDKVIERLLAAAALPDPEERQKASAKVASEFETRMSRP